VVKDVHDWQNGIALSIPMEKDTGGEAAELGDPGPWAVVGDRNC